ncbi:MAG: hypothetical protein R3D63_01875 [Paracoccaceae bacterium]
MTRHREYRSATELPPELMSIGSLNAYEDGPDHVRVACRLSDPNYEVGQLAILRISMTTFEVTVEYVVDQFFMGFHSLPGIRDILVETGGYVRRWAASEWAISQVASSFLRDGFSLAGAVDFVVGNDGEIFRSENMGEWSRDTTPTPNTILGIGGISANHLYAVGGNGTLLKARGSDWESIDLGLGTDLRCLLVGQEMVLVAGDRGIAGALAQDEFRLFETGIESDILSVAAFGGEIYFSDSDFGLHRLSGDAFLPVAELGYVYRLNSGPEWLTADAGEYVFQFNGKDWRGIEITFRDGYRAEPFDMSFLA